MWREHWNWTQECIPVGCVPPAHWPSRGGVSVLDCKNPGGVCPGGVCPGGVMWGCMSRGVSVQGVSARGLSAWGWSCDLSHHAFDVTCMLPPHQLSVNTSAAAYIVWPRCMLGYTAPLLWTEWQTGVKILPCRNFVVGGKNVGDAVLRFRVRFRTAWSSPYGAHPPVLHSPLTGKHLIIRPNCQKTLNPMCYLPLTVSQIFPDLS